MSLTASAEEKNGTSTGSTDDILKSTGNDELKFGLLISLLKVDQVPNKDVVDTVLHLVSTGIYYVCGRGILTCIAINRLHLFHTCRLQTFAHVTRQYDRYGLR
jgi:hypothetical protein